MSWLGIPKEELIGADWLSLQPPEQREPSTPLQRGHLNRAAQHVGGTGAARQRRAIGIYSYHVGPVSDGARRLSA